MPQALQALQSSLFAVGPTLHRYPIVEESPEWAGFGLFYFGNPQDVPFGVPKLADYLHKLFVKLCVFFEDSDTRSYRVFLRPLLRGFGGAGFPSAFMLEYFPNINIQQWELEWLLAHEVTHNWPLMDSTPGQPTRADNTWYNEGVATYYQILLLHRFGRTTRAEFLKELNSNLQAYYTNPSISLSNIEAAERMWTDPAAQRLPYHRGMMYFLHMDYVILLELLDCRRKGEDYGLWVWLELVAQAIGSHGEAAAEYEKMAEGGFLALSPHTLQHMGLSVVATTQEQLQLGFDTSSFNSRVIGGVVPDSRAEEAGLRDGDEVVETRVMYWQVADGIGRNMSMRLKRDGREFEVSYWPRLNVKVPSLQFVDAGALEL